MSLCKVRVTAGRFIDRVFIVDPSKFEKNKPSSDSKDCTPSDPNWSLGAPSSVSNNPQTPSGFHQSANSRDQSSDLISYIQKLFNKKGRLGRAMFDEWSVSFSRLNFSSGDITIVRI